MRKVAMLLTIPLLLGAISCIKEETSPTSTALDHTEMALDCAQKMPESADELVTHSGYAIESLTIEDMHNYASHVVGFANDVINHAQLAIIHSEEVTNSPDASTDLRYEARQIIDHAKRTTSHAEKTKKCAEQAQMTATLNSTWSHAKMALHAKLTKQQARLTLFHAQNATKSLRKNSAIQAK